MQSMLAVSLNHMVDDEQITRHTIIQITEFLCNTVQKRRQVYVVIPLVLLSD